MWCCCRPRVHRAADDEEEETVPIVQQPDKASSRTLSGVPQDHVPLVDAVSSSSSGQPLSTTTLSRSGTIEGDDLTRGKRLFNVSPEKGIKFLQGKGLVGATPEEVAAFLRESMFLDRSKIGDYISNPGEFYALVLQAFVDNQNFAGLEFGQALRKLLEAFRLPGEAQKIDRVMQKFANTYCAANPHIFASPDTAYILAFSLIMLNTDLHNPNIKNRMTKDAFVKNNRGINQGKDLPAEMLSFLYDSFKRQELQMDEGVTYEDTSYTFFNPEREGTLWKLSSKMRTWNRRFFVITGNCLYYFKNQEDKDPGGIIPLEDLSVREVDLSGVFGLDTSPKFCFEIYDANKEGNPKATIKAVKRAGGTLSQAKHTSYIFAADSSEERTEWVRCIRHNMAPPAFFSLMDRRRKLVKDGGAREGVLRTTPTESADTFSNVSTASPSKHLPTQRPGSSGTTPTTLANLFVSTRSNGTETQTNPFVGATPELSASENNSSKSVDSFASATPSVSQEFNGNPVRSSPVGTPQQPAGGFAAATSPRPESVLSRSFSGGSYNIGTAPSSSAVDLHYLSLSSSPVITTAPWSAPIASPITATGMPLPQQLLETHLSKFRETLGTPPSASLPRTRQGHNRSVSDTSALALATDRPTKAFVLAGPDGPNIASATTSTPIHGRPVSISGAPTQANTVGIDDIVTDESALPAPHLRSASAPKVASNLRNSVSSTVLLSSPLTLPYSVDGETMATKGPGSDITNEVIANVTDQDDRGVVEDGSSSARGDNMLESKGTAHGSKARHARDDSDQHASLLLDNHAEADPSY